MKSFPASRLLWCAPAIFVIGVTALATSWMLFDIYHAAKVASGLPSISETISTNPGSMVFQSLMCVVTPCIIVTWILNFFASRANLERLAAGGRNVFAASVLNASSCAIGIAAGLQLAALSVIRLHDGHVAHHWHILLSEGFYSTQVGSFLLDALCAVVRRGHGSTDAQAKSLRVRLTIGLSAVVMALVFLYLYIWREIVPDRWLSQAIYVACEYTLATLCFAYPMAAYTELRAYYRGARGRQTANLREESTEEYRA